MLTTAKSPEVITPSPKPTLGPTETKPTARAFPTQPSRNRLALRVRAEALWLQGRRRSTQSRSKSLRHTAQPDSWRSQRHFYLFAQLGQATGPPIEESTKLVLKPQGPVPLPNLLQASYNEFGFRLSRTMPLHVFQKQNMLRGRPCNKLKRQAGVPVPQPYNITFYGPKATKSEEPWARRANMPFSPP